MIFRTRQLKDLITQSFQVFNLYGRSPETVESLLKAFTMVLEPFAVDEITAGFKEWMKTKATMPTPADIRGLVMEAKTNRDDGIHYRQAPKREGAAPTVPWFGLQWSQFTDQHRQQLERHLDELGDKARGYIQHLNQFAKAPHPVSPIWARWKSKGEPQ